MAEKAKAKSKPVKGSATDSLKTKEKKTGEVQPEEIKPKAVKAKEVKSKQAEAKSVKSGAASARASRLKDVKSRESSKAKMKKKKVNLTRLYSEMNKLSIEANDKEIIKRFKIIIDSSEEDLAKVSVDAIIKDPSSVDFSSYHESLQPYIKHYLYMIKRDRSRAAKL